MKGLCAALWAEGLKTIKSKIFITTIIAFAFFAVMMGLILFVANHPELAGKSMTIRAKASFIGNGDWPAFFSLLLQSILALGSIGFGIVTAWVFGREYADRVIKDILALPVSRSAIVVSKFIIVFIWSLILAAALFTVGLATGLAVSLPGWSNDLALKIIPAYSISVLLTIFISTPVALVASMSRGYLLPIGYMIFVMILTQIMFAALPGIAQHFPWAIPALASGMSPDLPAPGIAGHLIFWLASLGGIAATVAWWRYADHF